MPRTLVNALGLPGEKEKNYTKGGATGGNYAGLFLYRCMEIAGVSDWSKIAGKTIRARIEDGTVKAIGHIVNEDWFDPSAEFAAIKESSHG